MHTDKKSPKNQSLMYLSVLICAPSVAKNRGKKSGGSSFTRPRRADGAAFHAAGEFDGEAGPGLDFEADLADGEAGAFTEAVGAVLDLGQGVVDFLEELAVFFHEADGEFLFVVVGAHVGHV